MQTAYIGMGANLPSCAGTPEATLTAAASRLESVGLIECRSSLYSTEPVGLADQPRFLNAVVALKTNLAPRALLAELLRIEKEYGRDRSSGIPNGPRTLDLDILLFGDLQISEPGLDIPHPRLADRAFVLVPLNEIAPYTVVSHNATVSELLQSLLSNSESQAHAVVRIQSEIWRAGPCRDAGNPDDSQRSAARAPDPDSRR